MITYNCVDTAKLLHSLNTASDEQAALTLDRVIPEQVPPRASPESLLCSGGSDDVGVQRCDIFRRDLVASQSLKDLHRLIVPVVSDQPSRRLVDHEA